MLDKIGHLCYTKYTGSTQQAVLLLPHERTEMTFLISPSAKAKGGICMTYEGVFTLLLLIAQIVELCYVIGKNGK